MNIPIIKLGIVRTTAVIHAVSTNIGITVRDFSDFLVHFFLGYSSTIPIDTDS